jgi:hypothetical protein
MNTEKWDDCDWNGLGARVGAYLGYLVIVVVDFFEVVRQR